MEGKITKAEAEARGFAVDTTVYPWVAYTGPRYKPTTWFTILTDLEAELYDALKLAQTHLATFGNIWECEVSDAHQAAQTIDGLLHKV
jgi:hypothetical protein